MGVSKDLGNENWGIVAKGFAMSEGTPPGQKDIIAPATPADIEIVSWELEKPYIPRIFDFDDVLYMPEAVGAGGPTATAVGRAKAEAEERAREEAEARRRAEAEAEIRAKEEAEAEARKKVEAEIRARKEAEAEAQRRAREEAEAEAEARAREAEAEARKRSEAEAEIRAREEAEAEARKRAEEEAEERAKEEAEAEARKKAEAEVRAREKAEAEAWKKAEAEARAKEKAEAKAMKRAEAEARAEEKAEAKEMRRAEAEARAEEKAEAKEMRRAEAEARAEEKAEAKELKRVEAEARAGEIAVAKAMKRAEAEARAVEKAEARAKGKEEAEARKRAEADVKAGEKAEAEALERAEAEATAGEKAEAGTNAGENAEEEALERADAEAKARKEAEVKTQAEMEAEARAEAHERAEAEARAKEELKTTETMDAAEAGANETQPGVFGSLLNGARDKTANLLNRLKQGPDQTELKYVFGKSDEQDDEALDDSAATDVDPWRVAVTAAPEAKTAVEPAAIEPSGTVTESEADVDSWRVAVKPATGDDSWRVAVKPMAFEEKKAPAPMNKEVAAADEKITSGSPGKEVAEAEAAEADTWRVAVKPITPMGVFPAPEEAKKDEAAPLGVFDPVAVAAFDPAVAAFGQVAEGAPPVHVTHEPEAAVGLAAGEAVKNETTRSGVFDPIAAVFGRTSVGAFGRRAEELPPDHVVSEPDMAVNYEASHAGGFDPVAVAAFDQVAEEEPLDSVTSEPEAVADTASEETPPDHVTSETEAVLGPVAEEVIPAWAASEPEVAGGDAAEEAVKDEAAPAGGFAPVAVGTFDRVAEEAPPDHVTPETESVVDNAAEEAPPAWAASEAEVAVYDVAEEAVKDEAASAGGFVPVAVGTFDRVAEEAPSDHVTPETESVVDHAAEEVLPAWAASEPEIAGGYAAEEDVKDETAPAGGFAPVAVGTFDRVAEEAPPDLVTAETEAVLDPVAEEVIPAWAASEPDVAGGGVEGHAAEESMKDESTPAGDFDPAVEAAFDHAAAAAFGHVTEDIIPAWAASEPIPSADNAAEEAAGEEAAPEDVFDPATAAVFDLAAMAAFGPAEEEGAQAWSEPAEEEGAQAWIAPEAPEAEAAFELIAGGVAEARVAPETGAAKESAAEWGAVPGFAAVMAEETTGAASEIDASGIDPADEEESILEPEDEAASGLAAGPVWVTPVAFTSAAQTADEALETEEITATNETPEADEAPPTDEETFFDPDEETDEEQERIVVAPPPRRKRSSKKAEQARKKKKRKKGLIIAHNIVCGFFAVVAVLLIIGVGYGASYLYSFVKDLPTHDLGEIEAGLKVMSTIYDDRGDEIKDLYLADARRELVTYDQIPKNLINAMIAIEDKTFWQHKGFNIIRIIGALRESYIGGGEVQGTSTITQQLARNIWLAETRSDYSLERKMREAFYARELEQNLTKEEILTHYLNMIALGNHSYGVSAAARLYFDKDLDHLDILECAALAALPQSPSKYSMITTVPPGSVDPDNPNILLTSDEYIFLYNEDAKSRIQLVLELMYDQGYITKAQYDYAMKDDIRRHLKPQPLQTNDNSSFFVDWLINNVADDLVATHPDDFPDTETALQVIYSGGLEIYSTFSQRIQDIATDEFDNPDYYPAAYMRLDRDGNALGEDNEITLFSYNNMFVNRSASDDNQAAAEAGEDPEAEPTKHDLAGLGEPWFRLNDSDFEILPNGQMIIFAGLDKRLGIYRTSGSWGEDISVEFKDFFTKPPGSFYIIKGGVIDIPTDYKGIDADGNLILSAKLFGSEDDVFTFIPFEDGVVHENGAAGEYWISPDHFKLDQPVIQPQGATVVLEHNTGQVKAMVGGRGIEGSMQYNRALSPRQPGSTMKPLGTYGAAMQKSAEGIPVNYPEVSFGEYWTPASVIEDEEMEYNGRPWPKNWYAGYRGPQTMRNAIGQSINVCAVRVQLAVGNKRSIDFLKSLGITTLVETGDRNDLNPAALALGGMTLGLTPLEIASAYGTYANAGIHVDPIGYTKVTYRNGDVLLDGAPHENQAMDAGAAFIMNDMLRTAVTNGIASRASVKGVPVAGKTGTTSENLDAWFVGCTPKYAAAVWIGNDTSIRMSQGSAAAAYLFSNMMTRICEGEDPGEFPEAPDNVERGYVDGISDYFIIGTKPGKLTYGDLICLDSGFLATPLCPSTERRVLRPLNGTTAALTEEEIAEGYQSPIWYCPFHNDDPVEYPVDIAAAPISVGGGGGGGGGDGGGWYNPDPGPVYTPPAEPAPQPQPQPKPKPKPKPEPEPADPGDGGGGGDGGDGGGDGGDGGDEGRNPATPPGGVNPGGDGSPDSGG